MFLEIHWINYDYLKHKNERLLLVDERFELLVFFSSLLYYWVLKLKIEWLLRDEQLATYFTRRSLDKKLIENVIEHVESSVNIHKSNCFCQSTQLMFVLGISKSIDPFLEV